MLLKIDTFFDSISISMHSNNTSHIFFPKYFLYILDAVTYYEKKAKEYNVSHEINKKKNLNSARPRKIKH